MEYQPHYENYPPRPLTSGEEQGWGVGLHLGGFLAWIIAPLIIWLVFRSRSRMLDDHGKATLNWQITVSILFAVLWLGSVVTMVMAGFTGDPRTGLSIFFVLFGLLALVMIGALIFSILGAVAAYGRRPFRYPLSIPFFC